MPPVTSTTDLLSGWARGIRILHVAHGIASERYAALARTTGVLVAVLTAVVGTTLFVSAATSANDLLRLTAGGLSLVAAVLGVAQIALNYPDLAVRHRQAFVDYGSLRRRLDLLRELDPAAPTRREDLDAFRVEWSRVESAAPVVPGRLRAAARRSIDKADATKGRSRASGPGGPAALRP